VFLKSYTELPVSFERVRAAMRQRPREWLANPAADAGRDGQRMLVEVGLEVRSRPVSRPAWLEVGEPVTGERFALLPLRLGVEDQEGLFPTFVGSLDAAWLGAGRTQLALSAQYEPPFGLLGRAADRTLLHRVAEAVAHHFLQEVAERLSDQLAANANGHGTHRGRSRPAPRP
jgi:hypothetical protein